MVLAGGWWVAIVSLWPADSRPYIGGSQDNSILELTLGYNGLGRLTGEETGSVGGGMAAGARRAAADVQRRDRQPGGLADPGRDDPRRRRAVVRPRRPPPPDRARALARLGAATGLTFSLMAGIFHPYYTVALAPAVAACIGIGSHVLWRHRESYVAAALLAAATAFTATWTFSLLGRTDWQPWLRYVVLVGGLGAAVGLFLVRLLPRRVGVAVAAAALVTALAGPTAYSLATAATPHTGSIPSAGPSVAADGFRGGPMGGAMPTGGGANTGGLLNGSTSSDALTALLSEDARRTPGWPPRSAPTRPPGTSSRPSCR